MQIQISNTNFKFQIQNSNAKLNSDFEKSISNSNLSEDAKRFMHFLYYLREHRPGSRPLLKVGKSHRHSHRHRRPTGAENRSREIHGRYHRALLNVRKQGSNTGERDRGRHGETTREEVWWWRVRAGKSYNHSLGFGNKLFNIIIKIL